MKKRKQKKLTLSLETLRQLAPEEVRPAAGGCTAHPPTLTQNVTCLCTTKGPGCA